MFYVVNNVINTCCLLCLTLHITRARRSLFLFFKSGLSGLKKLGVGVGERARRSGGPKNEIPAWGIIFGAASCENHDFGGVRPLCESPLARGKHFFTNFLAKIKNRMGFLHLGRALFIFCPLIYF